VQGEKNATYATDLSSVAVCYKRMREYAKAEPLYRQVLEIRGQVLGEIIASTPTA